MKPVRTGLVLAALGLIGACTPGAAPILKASDQSDIGRIESYLNSLPRFEAHFIQTGDYGPGAGLIWLDRPGHLRIDYEGPASRIMVIAGGRVRVLDRGSNSTTTMAVSRTPLGLLLAPEIALSGAAHINSLTHDGQQIRLVLSKQGEHAQGTLTLDFADEPLRLEAVTVIDARRQMLTMRLTGIDATPLLTPDLFQPPLPGPRS